MAATQGGRTDIHRMQRGLAAGAAVAAVLVVVWSLPTYFAPLHVLTAVPVAVPLFLLRRPAAFTRACVITGSALLAWGVLGVFMGLFLFWPAGILLLLAAWADPRRRPLTARIAGGAGVLVMAGALAASAVHTWHFHIGPALAEPHTFRAETDPGRLRDGIGDAEDRLRDAGATSVTGVGSDGGSYLEVRFPDDLPEEERARLKAEIARLPGIGRIDLCPVSECG
ncbi:hypothetical protein ACF1G0_07455 [Streptomyces sp. NPDC013953]|uniref:hypothetical protein n=1 Tax=Streptomyces sp. NPDC013953 TaxID=3364868 RepID=UPI0036F4E803